MSPLEGPSREFEVLSLAPGSALVAELALAAEETAGRPHEDDDRDDERVDENEIPVRETDEETEAPEEFEVDDEDDLGHPEDDDTDDDLDDNDNFDDDDETDG
jgi:hypothetical protein